MTRPPGFPGGSGPGTVLSALCEVVPDCALLCDREGRIIHANRPARELLGKAGGRLDDLLVPESGTEGIQPFVAGRGPSAGVSYLAKVHIGGADGRLVRVSLREIPLPAELGGTAVLVVIRARDESVTAMEALEAEIATRGDFPSLLAGVARHFLNLGFSEVETGIYRSLSAVGRVSHSQRAYLFLVGERGAVLERAFGWSAPECKERKLENIEGMAMAQFPWTLRHFAKGETVLVSDAGDLPDEAEAERAMCEYLGVSSYVNVPLRLRGRLAGWIGVDDHRPRVWGDDEIGLLRATGGLLLSAWEGKQRDEQLFLEQERAQRTLDCIGDGVICVDVDGRIEYVNPATEQMIGTSAAQARGRPLVEVLNIQSEEDGADAFDIVRLSEGRLGDAEFEGALTASDGRNRIVVASLAPLLDRSSRIRGAVLALRDVTEAREAQREAEHHANHDPLTGLVNRREFSRRLQRAVDSASKRGTTHALCYLDLDNFKIINDTSGHTAGDEALGDVAEKIKGRLRSRDTLARLGGDEFGLLLEDCDMGGAWEVCQGLLSFFRDYRFAWKGREFELGVSIGVTGVHEGCEGPSTLLTQADRACYRAKYLGRGRVHVFSPDVTELSGQPEQRMTVEELEKALSLGRIELHWQPVHDRSESGGTLYHEILCRLAGEDGELIGPDSFMGVARRHGLMPQLDHLVMEQGLRRAAGLHGEPAIGFNVGRESFLDDGFHKDVVRLVLESGIPAQRIWFELMEPDVSMAINEARRFMKPLVSAGCRFALDGVAGGLGTLQVVEALPIAAIKVGRPLVGSREVTSAAESVLRAIMDICRSRDIVLIAKDVVHHEEAERLGRMGVTHLQGGALGRPESMPGDRCSSDPAASPG
jgi:diguanylate cyclase (GGDEF)-like protein/PAS domain S-box-containing protein